MSGFMGSGKSSLGKKLVRLSGLKFTDLDTYIEQQEERSISSIFEAEGEAAFRQLEHRYLQRFLNEHEGFILALGGGTPCFFDNLELVKARGVVVYLRMSPAALYQRLQKGVEQRPLLAGKSPEAMLAFIDQLLREREAWYLQAQLVLDGISLTPKEVLTAIHNLLE